MFSFAHAHLNVFCLCRDEEEACLGIVRWLGRLHDLYGHQMVAGVILVGSDKQYGLRIPKFFPAYCTRIL